MSINYDEYEYGCKLDITNFVDHEYCDHEVGFICDCGKQIILSPNSYVFECECGRVYGAEVRIYSDYEKHLWALAKENDNASK